MDSFYGEIVSITENTAYKSVLIKHTDELYKLLMDKYEENITIAAKSGYSKSVIAMFNINAIYRGKTTIVDMLFPSDKFIKKCKKYGVQPVLDRMKSSLLPFRLEYEIANDHDSDSDKVAIIVVYWKIPKDSESESESDSDSKLE